MERLEGEEGRRKGALYPLSKVRSMLVFSSDIELPPSLHAPKPLSALILNTIRFTR